MQTELKKLRLRFIIIVVVIVSLIIGALFLAINSFITKSMNETGIETLRRVVDRPANFGQFDRVPGNVQLPYFILEIDSDMAIVTSYGGFYDLSDTESIQEALDYVVTQNAESGYIESFGLKYLVSTNRLGGTVIAFADVSSQMEMLEDVRIISMIIGLVAVAVFALLSVFLSKWAIKPVESSWNQQKQFVSDASHELKTPLTVITTNAEMLQMDDCSDDDREKYTNNIVTVAHQMRGLVEDLLNLARLEKGEQQNFEKFDLGQSLSDSIMQFEPVLFELGHTLNEDIAEGIIVNGSQQRLNQLLTILLDNAGKYSLPGDISVSLTRQGKNAVLCVKNPSEALSDQQLKDIFKRFYRTDESHNEKNSYGLGLSIAKSICESHGGKIHAEFNNGIISFIAQIPCI